MEDQQHAFAFKATLDKATKTLTVTPSGDPEKILSKRTLTKTTHKGHFSWLGERIDYLFTADRQLDSVRLQLWMYPVNLDYEHNPLEVELI